MEILFRGKRPEDGEWVYGYYVHTASENFISEYIIPYYASDLYGFHVYPATVGQYIGLKDKNCKRIFEGDVIKRFWMGSEIIYCVCYDGQDAHFIGKAMNKIGFTTFDNDGEMFEVIGNIHDNPELLDE